MGNMGVGIVGVYGGYRGCLPQVGVYYILLPVANMMQHPLVAKYQNTLVGAYWATSQDQ